MTLAQVLQPYLGDLLQTVIAIIVGLLGYGGHRYLTAHTTVAQRSQLQSEWSILGTALPVLERLLPGQPLATAASLANLADAHGFSVTGQMILGSLTKGVQQGVALAQQANQTQAAAPAATSVAPAASAVASTPAATDKPIQP